MATLSSLVSATDSLPLELPAIRSRGYGAYAVATALIHSGRFNIRGREYHSYGFCTLALQDLVADLTPTALLIPQFEFDAFTVTHPASISLTDSIASLPQPNTRGPVPDFVIVLARAISSATGMPIPRGIRMDSFEHWGKIKIENLVVGLVAEVKRRATRSAKSPREFKASLTGRLQAARDDALLQAAAGFRAHEATDRFLLLAWSGEWYSWMLAVREDYDVSAMPLRQLAPVSDDDAGEVIEEDDEDPNAEPGAEDGDELDSEWVVPVPSPTPSQQDIYEQEIRDQGPASLRPAGRGEREQPSRASKSKAATIEGFYAYQDPLVGVDDSKFPYDPNPNPKSTALKKEKTEPLSPRKPTKAIFRRYTAADLAGVMDTQCLLTPKECENADLFRVKWSDPILFGTPESEQNLYLIHRFLQCINTRLNEPKVLGAKHSSDDGVKEQNNESGSGEDSDENSPVLDDHSTESSGDEDELQLIV